MTKVGVRYFEWQTNYRHMLAPLMRVGLYHHGELLFDLECDPGETRNVIEQHPEVANRLRQLMTDFEADNPMSLPEGTGELEHDAGRWKKLLYGIAAAGFVVLPTIAIAAKLFWSPGKRVLIRLAR